MLLFTKVYLTVEVVYFGNEITDQLLFLEFLSSFLVTFSLLILNVTLILAFIPAAGSSFQGHSSENSLYTTLRRVKQLINLKSMTEAARFWSSKDGSEWPWSTMVMPIQKHLKCVCEHQTWIQKWWWWCLIDPTGYMCMWFTWRRDNVYSFSLQLAEVICHCAWALVKERKRHNIVFQVGANSM